MKGSASMFLNHVISVVSSIAKAKSLAIKHKAEAMKTRLIVLSLLKNKKLSMSAISHKVQALLGNQSSKNDRDSDDEEQEADNEISKAVVLYNMKTEESSAETKELQQGDDDDQSFSYHLGGLRLDEDDKYPDLTHSLFDEEDELDLGDPNSSVIEMVKNSKEDSENFNLEDEIDHVADLFIMKFHKRMRLQKLESFKRYQEMLARST